jgi:hypothetical protein
MTDYASQLPIRARGIYDSSVYFEPTTAGITAHLRTYAGVAASKVVQDLTYTAASVGVAGNSITITYTGTGTAGAEVVTYVGTALTVDLDPTPVTGSTATQVKAAVDAYFVTNPPAAVTVTITGTGSNVQTTYSVQPLAGGIDAILSDDTALLNRVTSITNGTVTALDVSMRDSSGAAFTNSNPLPVSITNAVTGTEVFVYKTDANVIKTGTSTNSKTPTATKTLQVQKVYGSSAGKAKFEVLWGTTGGEVVKIVGFNSTANPNWEYEFAAPQLLVDTQTIKVRVTNLDGQTDLYSVIEGVET